MKFFLRLTRHADAFVRPHVVETGTLVLARVRFALVEVDFTPRSRESGRAVADKRAGCVDADSSVFARGTLVAFVEVFRAVEALEALRAGTLILASQDGSVAVGVGVARV